MHFSTFVSLLSLVYTAVAVPSSISKRSGEVVQFAVDLTWGDFNPTGGVSRKAILTNGTIPGPALKLNVGDTVEFLVNNNLPNATSVHFHGIGQLNTPWADGTTGLSQTPIQPGTSYMYKWTADEAGTYFYHAHHKGQIMDGLYGAIIISDSTVEKPFNLISNNPTDVTQMTAAEGKNQPVFISDWTQYTFDEFYNIQKAANIDAACADSIIINGKGSVYCQSRSDIDAWTAPQIKPLLQAVQPPQMTDKGCLPPFLPATQGNFTFNPSALPANAYYTCTPSTGETETITVNKADGWAAMTFINTGGFSILKFTIDNHKMWVYAVSGDYVVPQQVDQITVGNGDRYSVLIKLDQQIGTYKINVANAGLNQIISGYAALSYQGASGPAPSDYSVMNYAGINTTTIVPFVDAIAAPYNAPAPASAADVTFNWNIKKLGQPHGSYEWTLSGIEGYNMSLDDQTPPLLFRDPSTVATSDLIYKTYYGQWVDMIVRTEGPLAEPHPLHKHANKAYVIGMGVGDFNFTSVAAAQAAMPQAFNLKNPPYRDTWVTVPAEGNSTWTVFRYKADHPGVWFFHCHMQTHFSGGMGVVLMDAVDKFPTIPSDYLYGNGMGNSTNSTGGYGHGSTSNGGTSTGINGTATASSTGATATPSSFKGAATSIRVPNVFASSALILAVATLFTFAL